MTTQHTEKLIAAYTTACDAKRRGIDSRQKFDDIAEFLSWQGCVFWDKSNEELAEKISFFLAKTRPDFKRKYKDLSLQEALDIFKNN